MSADLMSLTASIVAAHVGHNNVPAAEVRGLIEKVYSTLASLGNAPVQSGKAPSADRPQPAVPVKKSVQPEYIVCLEDGKKLKMLKRHLMTAYNMSPEQYRERWNLPSDYPMTAPGYAEQRSKLAKQIGLGKAPRKKAKKAAA